MFNQNQMAKAPLAAPQNRLQLVLTLGNLMSHLEPFCVFACSIDDWFLHQVWFMLSFIASVSVVPEVCLHFWLLQCCNVNHLLRVCLSLMLMSCWEPSGSICVCALCVFVYDQTLFHAALEASWIRLILWLPYLTPSLWRTSHSASSSAINSADICLVPLAICTVLSVFLANT